MIFCFTGLAQGATSYHVRLFAGSDWVGDGGPARDSIFLQAQGIATGRDGSIFVSDALTNRVRKIGSDGIVRTVAGTGHSGFSGDGGPATQAQLNAPYGIAVDASGNLYIADLGNARVRMVATDGTISTIAGGGTLLPGGLNESVAATSVQLKTPRNVALDGAGNLYFSDFDGQRVFRRNAGGALRTFAGTGTAGKSGDSGPAELAMLRYPTAVAVDSQGAVYIGDSQNHAIRKVDSSGVIRTFAGVTTPVGLAFDASGTLYTVDAYIGFVERIASSGGVLPLDIPARDLTFGSDGNLYSTDGTLVRRSPPKVDGYVVIAGRGDPAHGDFGPATEARLNRPKGVAVASNGDVYIADTGNYRIRRVQSDGTITTVAGSGIVGNGGDGGPATLASMESPIAIAIDAQDNVYFTQKGDDGAFPRVRRFTTGGAMLAVAETPDPTGITVDTRGNLYIAEHASGKIYRVNAGGGLVAVSTQIFQAQAIAAGPDGSLYFIDRNGIGYGYVSSLYAVATSINTLGNLTGVTVMPDANDPAGSVYITDANSRHVFRFPPHSGGLLPLVLDDFIGVPSGIAAGPNGVLYVSDSEGGKVWALEPIELPKQLNVLNAANRLPGAIAPGMLVVLSGAALQTAMPQVTIGGLPAQVLSTSGNSEIVVQSPATLATGDAVPIELREDRSGVSVLVGQATVAVRDAAPALFTNGSLSDSVSQALAVNEDGSVNNADHPASRGSVIVLYGTGEGVTGGSVAVTIGGYGAEVLYAGPAPGFPGLLQINARVPESIVDLATTPIYGALEVTISVGAATSSSGTDIVIR